MAVKKSYNRYFIIFQEEDKGYGIAIDKQPTGYTKIENRSGKCKITVYAQNLIKERGPYYCCLVDTSKDPLVMARLGTINIDDTGRGETWWEYREDDVADTGVPFDRFNVAAVITEDNKINAPLAGYIGKDKVSWKDRVPLVPRHEEQPAAEAPAVKEPPEETSPAANVENEETEEMDEEAKKFKAYEENINANSENSGERWKKEKENKENVKSENKEDKKEGKKDKDDEKKEENKKEGKKEKVKSEKEKSEDKKDDSGKHDDKNKDREENVKEENIKENPKAAAEKGDSKDDPKDNPKEEAAKKVENYPNVIEPFNYDEDIEAKEVSGYMSEEFNKNFDRKGDKEKRPFATMFHDILEDFDEEDDLTDEFKNTRWWRIPLSDELPISENIYYPYYCAIYHLKMTYPYINYIKYFKDTGHYYFGMKYDDSGEVKYILYGIEGSNAHNSQPYMGMTGFIRWIKMKNRDRGMWIMYYNPHTGNIMIPKKR